MTKVSETKKLRSYKNPKRKISFGIVSILIIAIFLMPISPSFQNKNGNLIAGVEVNKARAEILPNTTFYPIPPEIKYDSATKLTTLTISAKSTDGKTNYDKARHLFIVVYDLKPGENVPPDIASKHSTVEYGIGDQYDIPTNQSLVLENIKVTVTALNLDTQYYYLIIMTDGILSPYQETYATLRDVYMKDGSSDKLPYVDGTFTIPSTDPNNIITKDSNASGTAALSLGCGVLGWEEIQGCIASFFYLIWSVSAWIAELAGAFLDFLVYYSTNSSSYTNGFVTKAFGAIRDVANIFFIIALLFVAIKTILDLNVTNNKKLIGTIVVVALLINFSLFTTQIIIDGSNILAKVFYNQISSVDKTGAVKDPAAGGEKSISVGLVDKFDPQEIVTQSSYIDLGPGKFIFITILLIAITLYTAYIFFVVGLLFVGRVVMLWLSMIFSPIAFASYTMPFDIPGFGHKEWWKNLLDNAFLAPIFIFFLYIIVMFAGFLEEIIQYPDGADIMQKLMAVIIPFIILAVMLMKAKSLAIKLSGEMGAAISKVGKVAAMAVGGVALGAVAGGAAVAGRATIGRAGSAIANSGWAKNMASSKNVFTKFIGNKAMNVGQAVGKGSMDIRGAKIAGVGLAGATGLKLGEAKKGGFEQAKKDQIEKKQKRAQELKPGAGEKEVKALRKSEVDHQTLLNDNKKTLDTFDKDIEIAGKKLNDIALQYGHGSDEARAAGFDLQNKKDRKTAFVNGGEYEGDRTGEQEERIKRDPKTGQMMYKETTLESGPNKGKKVKVPITEMVDVRDKSTAKNYSDINAGNAKDKNGNEIIGTDGKPIKRTISYLEKTEIKDNKQEVLALERKRALGFAKGMDTIWGKAFDLVGSGGMNSGLGSNEAAYRIRMDQKIDSGTKT